MCFESCSPDLVRRPQNENVEGWGTESLLTLPQAWARPQLTRTAQWWPLNSLASKVCSALPVCDIRGVTSLCASVSSLGSGAQWGGPGTWPVNAQAASVSCCLGLEGSGQPRREQPAPGQMTADRQSLVQVTQEEGAELGQAFASCLEVTPPCLGGHSRPSWPGKLLAAAFDHAQMSAGLGSCPGPCRKLMRGPASHPCRLPAGGTGRDRTRPGFSLPPVWPWTRGWTLGGEEWRPLILNECPITQPLTVPLLEVGMQGAGPGQRSPGCSPLTSQPFSVLRVT